MVHGLLIICWHVSLGYQRLIEAFIILRSRPGGPAAFFSDVSVPAGVFDLGDSIMVRQWEYYYTVVWITASSKDLAVIPRLGSKFMDLCPSNPYDIRFFCE